jgi:hypothetical protein
MVTDAPDASVSNRQVKVPFVIPQPSISLTSDHASPVGSLSVSLTSVAAPLPTFETLIVKIASSPALIGPLPVF